MRHSPDTFSCEQLGNDSQTTKLRFISGGDKPDISVVVEPDYGNNITSIRVDRHELIHTDIDTIKSGGMSGFPFMFPAPGRLRTTDGRSRAYNFRGQEREIRAEDQEGVPDLVHGFMHIRPSEIVERAATQEKACVRTLHRITKEDPLYTEDRYPFPSTFALEFVLRSSGLEIRHSLTNDGAEDMPVSYGTHAFWKKLDDETNIIMHAESVLAVDSRMIPTGDKQAPDEVFGYDLFAQPISVGDIALDHAFTDLTGNVVIHHPSSGIIIVEETSEDFDHEVIWTPSGESFFATEPIIGPPNALNGSPLIVRPGETIQGRIFYGIYTN